MQPDSKKYLFDIRRAARLIEGFCAGRSFEDYVADEMLKSAVERQFGIIGEALSRLAKGDPTVAGQVADAPRRPAASASCSAGGQGRICQNWLKTGRKAAPGAAFRKKCKTLLLHQTSNRQRRGPWRGLRLRRPGTGDGGYLSVLLGGQCDRRTTKVTMATNVKLSDALVSEARRYAGAQHRSVPKQIEYWSRIGKIAEENPDLLFAMIREILAADREEAAGEYRFG